MTALDLNQCLKQIKQPSSLRMRSANLFLNYKSKINPDLHLRSRSDLKKNHFPSIYFIHIWIWIRQKHPYPQPYCNRAKIETHGSATLDLDPVKITGSATLIASGRKPKQPDPQPWTWIRLKHPDPQPGKHRNNRIRNPGFGSY